MKNRFSEASVSWFRTHDRIEELKAQLDRANTIIQEKDRRIDELVERLLRQHQVPESPAVEQARAMEMREVLEEAEANIFAEIPEEEQRADSRSEVTVNVNEMVRS